MRECSDLLFPSSKPHYGAEEVCHTYLRMSSYRDVRHDFLRFVENTESIS
jgi:hypothetical protein